MNLCRSCNQDFSSVKLFDLHRVGKHAYTFQEGLMFDPPVDDGRRCLDTHEMTELGWTVGGSGRWSDPARSADVRERFRVRPGATDSPNRPEDTPK